MGIFKIIKDINYFLQCGLEKARLIFEQYGMLSIKYREPIQNKIIYKKYLHQFKKFIIYKVEFLNKVIAARVKEMLDEIILISNKITDVNKVLLILSGKLLTIPGIKQFINYHYSHLNIKLYDSKIMGVLGSEFAAALGSLYYCNNKMNIESRIAQRINYDDENINKVINLLAVI